MTDETTQYDLRPIYAPDDLEAIANDVEHTYFPPEGTTAPRMDAYGYMLPPETPREYDCRTSTEKLRELTAQIAAKDAEIDRLRAWKDAVPVLGIYAMIYGHGRELSIGRDIVGYWIDGVLPGPEKQVQP